MYFAIARDRQYADGILEIFFVGSKADALQCALFSAFFHTLSFQRISNWGCSHLRWANLGQTQVSCTEGIGCVLYSAKLISSGEEWVDQLRLSAGIESNPFLSCFMEILLTANIHLTVVCYRNGILRDSQIVGGSRVMKTRFFHR